MSMFKSLFYLLMSASLVGSLLLLWNLDAVSDEAKSKGNPFGAFIIRIEPFFEQVMDNFGDFAKIIVKIVDHQNRSWPKLTVARAVYEILVPLNESQTVAKAFLAEFNGIVDDSAQLVSAKEQAKKSFEDNIALLDTEIGDSGRKVGELQEKVDAIVHRTQDSSLTSSARNALQRDVLEARKDLLEGIRAELVHVKRRSQQQQHVSEALQSLSLLNDNLVRAKYQRDMIRVFHRRIEDCYESLSSFLDVADKAVSKWAGPINDVIVSFGDLIDSLGRYVVYDSMNATTEALLQLRSYF